MKTLIRFISRLIVFLIGFILCAWLFLDIAPAESWQKITRKIQSLYSSTTNTAGTTIQSAANLSETLVNKTAEQLNNAGAAISETTQTSVETF